MAMSKCLISVITVCLNSSATIEKTIKSVLEQTYDNFEYIIIDGGSKDKTIEIINKYKPLFGGKLTVISEKDNGIYDAMNKGIAKSSGDLICLLNSDDWYEKNAFEIMASEYHGEKYKIQYAMQRVIKDEREEMCVIYRHEFINERMIPHQTCFVTRGVYDLIGLFDLNYKSAADYDFMIRAIQNSNVIMKPIYRIIACFRCGGMSESFRARIEQAKIQKKYGFISRKRYLIKIIKANISNFLF